MSLTSNADGPETPRTTDGWRLALAAVASRRGFALFTAFAATLGLLPLYDAVWWWDLLTHTLSGAVIGGWLLLARRRAAAVLAVVAVLTGAWELAEYATPNYVFVGGGPADTALDAVCNFAGAGLALLGGALARRRGWSGDAGRKRSGNTGRTPPVERSGPETGPTDD